MLNDLHTFCTVQQIFIKPLLYVSDTVLGAGRIGKSRDLFKTVLQMLYITVCPEVLGVQGRSIPGFEKGLL